MTPIEELDLLLTLIRKYDLPLSPILEYAVTEKKEENSSNMPVEEEENDDCSTTSESPDFVIAYPKNSRQRVLLFSDAYPSAWSVYRYPCSEVA